MNRIWLLTTAFLMSAGLPAATPPPFLLKWDLTIATPEQRGLVALAPGTKVTLDSGETSDVFEILRVPVPESEKAHKAVSVEFRFRFSNGTKEVAKGTVRADQHGPFIPAQYPARPRERYIPARQALSSTDSFTIPGGADWLEIERVDIDSLNHKTVVSKPVPFALVGNNPIVIASGESRGDMKTSPPPYSLGAPIMAGDSLTFVFHEFRAMNAWVRTAKSKSYLKGIVATISGADSRTVTCVNKDPGAYYTAWADLPLFETVTRVRFDGGNWQTLRANLLFPLWGSTVMKTLFPIPFAIIPGIFRAADPYNPKTSSTIFSDALPSKLAPIHLGSLVVPPKAKTVSVQTFIHAFLVAHYGTDFEGKPYVGSDCIQVFADRQRVELEDLWDTPDFTPATAWTFPVKSAGGAR